jgi:N-acylneuraminate cytidylyltransferase
MTDKQIVCIIPARGGSKGIPHKNIMDFCGKPLLAWSIIQAREAETVSRVYVTSDAPEILEVAQQYGASPILRPPELATDTATSEAALLHALGEIEKMSSCGVDLVVFLQATSPLRESADIDGSVRLLLEAGADSLFSVAILDDYCIWKKEHGELRGLTFNPLNRGRRQDREPLFLENGSIYVFRPEILRTLDNRLGGRLAIFAMPFWKSYEIDTLEEVAICEFFFRKNLLARQPDGGPDWTIPRQAIDLVAFDFDGVMTDNRVLVLQDGTEGIVANRADGLGVDRLRGMGLHQMIITTEMNPVVGARAKKLNLEIISGCRDKKSALQDYCRSHGYDLRKVVYVGNDVNDLAAMQMVGFPIAPADAHPRVKAVSWGITRADGGNGVVKELAERITGPLQP